MLLANEGVLDVFNMTFMRFLFLFLMGLAVAGSAQSADEEVYTDLIHADVPLWGIEDKGIWPRSFSDGESFGCSHRVALGDWKIVSYEQEESWSRIRNYGVFHCASIFSHADIKEELKTTRTEYGYFVELGFIKIAGKEKRLWAVQQGTRPGSRYTLLLQTSEDGTVSSFDVLQSRCPKTNWRKGPNMDVWPVSYCAINSRDELISLARKMAILKPVAKMEWIADAPKEED